VNFDPVDAKPRKADISHHKEQTPNKRFYNVSPCVMLDIECSLSSRKKAKKLLRDKNYNFREVK
jgi:hypothetical protein